MKHRAGEYVFAAMSTLTDLENFWKHLKGLHQWNPRVHVSKKHLAKYAKEFEFRFNRRENPSSMFGALVSEFPQP